MNSRLDALISRGYSREEVERLANFTDEELEYASDCAFKHISRNCYTVEDPNAIYVGGQPGSGKTIMSMKLKNKIGNVIEIGIDNYRMYHPRYLEIEKCIREHWDGREEHSNDTPGNDMADFTHFFAGAMTDKLIEKGKNGNYNMLLEWGMRDPNGPLKSMSELKQNNYNNIVLFVATPKDISYEACKLRSDLMKNSKHIIRKVPKYFHDLCVETLPESVDCIYKAGYEKNIIDYMAIISRDSQVIWDDKIKKNPGNVYSSCLNYDNYSKKNNPFMAVTTNLIEMQGLKENPIKGEESIIIEEYFDINSKIK